MNFFFFLSLNGFVLLPLYIQGLGGTEVEIGFVMGLYSGVGILCQPLIGPFVDAFGRRPFMVAGIALLIASELLAVAAHGFVTLALVRALQGIAFSAYFVATFSYVVDLVPPAQRGWALGLYGVSGLAATAIAPLFGEWVIRRFGFRPLFIICAVLAVAAAAFVVTLREHQGREVRPVEGFPWEHGAMDELRQWYMAVTIFFGLGAGTLFAFLPTFAEAEGVSTLALFYTAYSGAAMGARVFGGRLIDTRGRRAVIVPAMLTQAISAALLAGLGLLTAVRRSALALPVLVTAGMLSGAAHGFLYPSLAALVADRAPEDRRASAVAIFSSVFLFGNAGGAFLFGYVAHALGYAPMWALLAALLLLGWAASWRLDAARS
jgi:MFS family permease